MTTLTLDGELTFATAAQRLRALPRDGGAQVDLSGVTRMDSSGAALLVEIARRAGTRPRITGANEQAAGLLRFLELDHLFDLPPPQASAT